MALETAPRGHYHTFAWGLESQNLRLDTGPARGQLEQVPEGFFLVGVFAWVLPRVRLSLAPATSLVGTMGGELLSWYYLGSFIYARSSMI